MNIFIEHMIIVAIFYIIAILILWSVETMLLWILNSAKTKKRIKVPLQNADKNSKLGVKISKTPTRRS